MTRGRVLLLGSVAVVATIAVTGWFASRPSAINPENAARIKNGMTLAEVEAILNGPARDESTGPTEPLPYDGTHTTYYEGPAYPRVSCWTSDTAYVQVVGDADTIWFAEWWPMRRRPQGVLDTLRRWLRL